CTCTCTCTGHATNGPRWICQSVGQSIVGRLSVDRRSSVDRWIVSGSSVDRRLSSPPAAGAGAGAGGVCELGELDFVRVAIRPSPLYNGTGILSGGCFEGTPGVGVWSNGRWSGIGRTGIGGGRRRPLVDR